MTKEFDLRERLRDAYADLDKLKSGVADAQLVVDKMVQEKVPIVHCGIDTGAHFGISMAGTRKELATAFKILRRHGYEPSSRPQPGETIYGSFFRQDKRPTIWFYFSSTQCRRVVVGKVVKEVEVTEIRCDEALEDKNGTWD